MTILVVDDDKLTLNAVESALKKEGHDVLVCENGKEASDLLQEETPDLIVSDIVMPYKSGLELLQEVKNTTGVKVPMIVVSGLSKEDTVKQAFSLGADDFMFKPLTLPVLIQKIKHIALKKNIPY
ncbi:MAG: response regulator [Bacteroidetes bacterium]|jgi:DNA-binding response OmpR family regulator|nr:MAG: response regulator [Bacteroidota bacterium]TAE62254.1 MAG: response regulator [Bacteroidota bacterium]TAF92555.1 MAG: response regulator [Bacteroidota bacterium]